MENKRYTSKRIENSFAIYLSFRRFHKFVVEILFLSFTRIKCII